MGNSKLEDRNKLASSLTAFLCVISGGFSVCLAIQQSCDAIILLLEAMDSRGSSIEDIENTRSG